jgi:hypothetical protein
MATTIVVTTAADGSVSAKCAGQTAWGVYVPAGANQIKRILWAIKSLLEVNESLT